MHDISLLVTLAGALAIALLFGWVTQRLGLSTLMGYLLAGVVVGPHTPGFVADADIAARLAEIGVILLLFSVGTHFDLHDLLRVRRVAVPGAIVQSAVAGVTGWAVARAFGWSNIAGAVFGMSLAVASTAVLTRMLIDHRRLDTHGGHVAVGWLVVEDVFTVIALVLLPALAASDDGDVQATRLGAEIAWALAKAAAFALLLWLTGHRVLMQVVERVARTRSEELFTLAVFVVALGIAVLAAGVFQVSVALGAFFAGLVIGRSRLGPQAAAYMAPFRDVFSALFFVSVGMLFDPAFLLNEPLKVLAGVAIVLVAKPLAALVIVRALGDSRATAETVAVGLAQIGEFSFLLGTLGVLLGVMPQQALDTLIATALITIALNPLLFGWLGRREAGSAPPAAEVAGRPEAPASHALLCGDGALHRALIARLRADGAPFAVVDADLDFVDALANDGVRAVYGDASRIDVLRAAGIDRAESVVVTAASLPAKMAICLAVRRANPAAAIVVAANDDGERAWLAEFGADEACNVTAPAVDALKAGMSRARSHARGA